MARVDRRLLLLAMNLPFPPHAGADLRNWQNVNGLLAAGSVAVFGLRAQPPGVAPRNAFALWRSSQDPACARGQG
jgi:hypothetical protein